MAAIQISPLALKAAARIAPRNDIRYYLVREDCIGKVSLFGLIMPFRAEPPKSVPEWLSVKEEVEEPA